MLEQRADLALYLPLIKAYPSGFTFTLSLRFREVEPEHRGAPGFDLFHARADDGKVSPDLLRFGIEFSNGRKATNLDRFVGAQPHKDGPVLSNPSGHGTGRAYDQHYWVSPLPPPGDLVIAWEWPAWEILLATSTIAAETIRDAAGEAIELWPATPA